MRPQIRSVVIATLLVVSFVGAVAPVGAQSGTDDAVECSFPVSMPDATGANVTVEERPERIVVLQPSAAQTVWELDAENRVVGAPVVSYTEYLDGIEEKENVLNADEFSVNQEAVVLAPNIVPDETITSLREADQIVFKFGFGNSLAFVADKTEQTGRLIGSCGEAAETNDQYWDRIEAVESGTDGYEAPRVLYYTDGFGAGSGTFIDEIITTAGGTNVAAENGVEGYGELNAEALVEWDPEVILVSDTGPGIPETDAFNSTFAVRNDQVVAVNGNYISQPAPRIAIVLEDVAAALEAAETAEDTDPSEETTDDAPGFGVVVAATALVSIALLARRRR